MALIKIAYGIAVEVDTDSTQRLLSSTRAMGIYDFKAAQSIGTAFKIITEMSKERFSGELTRVFLFDIASPWALVSEINSTHPLTGKRIRALSGYAKETGKASMFDFEKVKQEELTLEKTRLYGGFAVGIFVYTLPVLAILAGFGIMIVNPQAYPLAIMILGLSLLLQGLYRFRKLGADPEQTTVFELMKDPYANPLRGRFVELEGRVIGKADAGSYLGEDVKMQDKSDCLIYLNYESIVPVLGNIFFGLGKAKKMIGKNSRAIGWFRRSSYQVIDLDTVVVEGEVIKSYTRFWGIISGIVLLLIGFVIYMNVRWLWL
jgi:ABC-type proline/glycine betaine transport system permease subunit